MNWKPTTCGFYLGALMVTAIFFLHAPLAICASSNIASTVPFVGCAGDSSNGAEDPLSGNPVVVNIPPLVALKVSFYAGEGIGVLAPRGWKCHGAAGNAFTWLWVYPSTKKLNTGPIVAVQNVVSDTGPGIIYFNKICARYFQTICSKKDWVATAHRVWGLSENDALAPNFRSDFVSNITNSKLQYETPPRQIGLATYILDDFPFYDQSINRSNDLTYLNSIGLIFVANQPITDNSIVTLNIRLPTSDRDVGLAILKTPPELLLNQSNF